VVATHAQIVANAVIGIVMAMVIGKSVLVLRVLAIILLVFVVVFMLVLLVLLLLVLFILSFVMIVMIVCAYANDNENFQKIILFMTCSLD
jgi:hypothetical protein